MLLLAGCLALLLGASCGRKQTGRVAAPQPIGDGPRFLALLDEAMRRADPQGAILVVLWSTNEEPPAALERIAREWNRYGLIPIGVCLDLTTPDVRARSGSAVPTDSSGSTHGRGPGKDPRETAIARVRSWERSHKAGIRGMIFDGDPGVLERSLGLSRSIPSVVLLSAQGAVLWSRAGFGGLDDLEAVLNVHLGQPPLAHAAQPAAGAALPSCPRPIARGPAEAAG